MRADSPSSNIAENFTFSAEDMSTYLVGNGSSIPAKKLFFPLSQNEYEIVSVTDGGSTYVITVAGTVSGENIADYPRIVDQETEYYRFKLRSTPGNSSMARPTTRIETLYEESVYNPQFTTKMYIAHSSVQT